MQAGSVLEGDLGAVGGASGTTVVPGRRAGRDHELRAALSGIEASASELSQHRDQLSSTQVDELVNCLVAEIRRLSRRHAEHVRPRRRHPMGGRLCEGFGSRCHLLPTARRGGRRRRRKRGAGPSRPARERPRARRVLARRRARGRPRRRGRCLVEDRGPGISAPLRRRLFERGVGGQQTGRTELGLHVAHRLMTDQGGSICVRPRRGGGTTFVLRFKRVSSR
jgi:Histidine kinase-, DNA gyrase B-, and HSP90-like ATPase